MYTHSEASNHALNARHVSTQVSCPTAMLKCSYSSITWCVVRKSSRRNAIYSHSIKTWRNSHEVKVVLCSLLPAVVKKQVACVGLPPTGTLPLLYSAVWQHNAVNRSRYADNAVVLFWKDTPSFLLQEELEVQLKKCSVLTQAVIQINWADVEL